ncbi:signal recognition particle receptor FtsY [Erysipelotrichaceae bacterium]|nr:signal recognition particle receptor FtsY [Erysipelotrichaceae bacterium]
MHFFEKFKNIFKSDTIDSTGENDASIQKYHQSMTKSRGQIMKAFSNLMQSFEVIDDAYFEELEDALIMADVGLNTVIELSKSLQERVKNEGITDPQALNSIIIQALHDVYQQNIGANSYEIKYAPEGEPTVILFVGVNGAGKTTSIGKLAARLKGENKKVLLAAADTFRAGATQQLKRWAERASIDIVSGKDGSDPSGVIFDAVRKAKNEHYDVLLCDTAGRLQNKVNLMKELEKIYRVIQKELPDAPHETFLVIDATTGQNGLVQAKAFTEAAPLTGVVLSKLDGSAKGGIVLAIAKELKVPVKFIGLGEQLEDLAPFVLENYLYGLFAELFTDLDV